MNVEEGSYATASSSEETHLETHGLGPCIGAAVIYKDRGFLLHSADVIVEEQSTTTPFFEDIERFIPRAARAEIRPVLAGGSRGDHSEIQESTLNCHVRIKELFAKAGFGKPRAFWGTGNQSHSIILDLRNETARIERDDLSGYDTLKPFTVKF